ncbi:NAD-dependent protein deacetylase [subsurface metagenome]
MTKEGFFVSINDQDIILPDSIPAPNGEDFHNKFHLHPLATADIFVPCGGSPAAININNWKELLNDEGKPKFRIIIEGITLNEKIIEAKELISGSKKITILTGAGISTESGIADFRSPGGVWSHYKTVTIQEFVSDTEKRKYYWKYKSDTIPSMLAAEPNAAHLAIGKLDREKKLFRLLTQNIDGLHERGGVDRKRIIRLHGTNKEVICLSCNKVQPIEGVLERIGRGEEDPKCKECGGLLKPNTVSFGQSLNPEHLRIAELASRECDLFMALGSSLQVYPACGYVEVAHNYGKKIIIINRAPTPYDSMAACCFSDSLAEIMARLV